MGIKNARIRITLKSDLCVGSGYSFAGIVDSDAYYDEHGIPYIPARRIRGCLRDSAVNLLYVKYDDNKVQSVFGESGSNWGSSFKIDNAYIEDYEKITEDLKSVRDTYGEQVILSRFSHIVGQTRIDGESGAADDSSLRYTRVINRLSPVSDKNMTFYAKIVYDESDEPLIADACKATRHIGLKRNRGLGNVEMRLEFSDRSIGSKENDDQAKFQQESLSDGRVRLYYAIENMQPLMISGNSEDTSIDYIPGQQMIGLLAGRYLSEGKGSADGEEFRALFLGGDVIFSNLYPYNDGHIHYPAPDYINRLKKTKKYVSTIAQRLPEKSELSDSLNWENGNQPKKMKGKFIHLSDDRLDVLEVEKDVVYHHSHINTHETQNNKEEGILYSFEVIRSGQKFAGSITGESKHIEMLKNLLSQVDLYIGKSKSAQYGKCRLASVNEDIEYATGSKNGRDIITRDIVVTFRSDAIIINEDGNPTVFRDEVIKAVANSLGLSDLSVENLLSDDYIMSLQTGLSTGYLGVWNLRRPTVPVIKAGSFITFKYTKDTLPETSLIGERIHEGYGQITVDWAAGYPYDAFCDSENRNGKNGTLGPDKKGDISCDVKRLIKPIIYDWWLDAKINEAIGESNIKGSNAAAGRFALMLKESETKYKGDYNKIFSDFAKRIQSIKRDETRREGEKLLEKIGTKLTEENNAWVISDDSAFMKTELKPEEKGKPELEMRLRQIGEKVDREEKCKRWVRYIMAILVNRKYIGGDK